MFIRIFIFIGLLFLLIGANQKSATMQTSQIKNQVSNYLMIRKVHYPVTKTNDPKNPPKLKYCLLTICPEGIAACPMIAVGMDAEGKPVLKEYDVVKAFKNKKEAQGYAKKNSITNVAFD